MKVKKVSTSEAVGHILLHNQAGPNGRKALKKGQVLGADDIVTLKTLGRTEVYVAVLERGDLAENKAADDLSQLLGNETLDRSTATTGRVNLIANTAGVFKVNIEALFSLNDIEGITLATLPNNTVVQPKKRVSTVKVIPFSIPKGILSAATSIIVDNSPLVHIKPFVMRQAVLITTGSEAARSKVIGGFTPVLRNRLASYQVELIEGPYVPENEQMICQALEQALADNRIEMVIIAGETSIMDGNDITPRAIKAAGGQIIHHGVPVEPGNLFLLAYRDRIPIVGAPGCAKSKRYNVVDMILPRLAAGEDLTRRDLIALGHGGYLQ